MDQDTKHEEVSTRHIMGGTIWLTIANGLVMVIGLAMVMVATRKFPATVYGSYILLFVMSNFLTQFTSLGINVAITRSLAMVREREEKEFLVNGVLILRFIVYGLVVVLVWFLGPYLFKFFGAVWDIKYFYFVIMLYFIDSFSNSMQAILQGFFCFRQLAIWNFASSVLNISFLFLFLGYFTDGMTTLVFARWLAYILAGIYMFISIPVRKRFVLNWGSLKGILKFGWPLQINDIMGFIYGRVGTLMIASMLAPENIAFFEVARKIPDSLLSFFDAFNMTYFPLFSRLHSNGENIKAESFLKNALRLVTFVSLCMAAVAFLFGQEIMHLLFSAQYAASAPIFVILMITLTFTLIGYLLGNSLVAVGESDKPAKINLVHVSISLLSNWLLIPMVGILGAGISQLLGPIATNPLNYFALNRKFNAKVASAYLKPIAIFLVWAGVFYLLHQEALIFKVSALIVFLGLNFVFSVVTSADMRFFQTQLALMLETPLKAFRKKI